MFSFALSVLLLQLTAGYILDKKDADLITRHGQRTIELWNETQAARLEEMDEKEFEDYFGLDPVVDSEEFARKQKALKLNVERIKDVNQEFSEGKKALFDSVNLAEDEFLERMPGVLEPTPEEEFDQRSDQYFNGFRYNRQAVPDEYSAVDEGIVSPVKDQGSKCGSCVAFASMSSIETCFKKITGVFGDYSEQQMVDCGYRKNGANACIGAQPHAYLKWAGDNKIKFASEEEYPYEGENSTLKCPENLPVFNQGAKVSGYYYTYSGDEELLKKMVYTHGSVISSVSGEELRNYRGGIFSGCTPGNRINHAISVVGYGTENGKDFWLIKNSWGTWWGDKGYFKLERGSQMCGIGPVIVATECEKSSDSPVTDPPTTTTAAPTTVDPNCVDALPDCEYFTADWCWDKLIKRKCQRSCGLCKGQTPVESTYLFDRYPNCGAVVDLCNTYKFIAKKCKKTCKTQNA